LGVAPVVVITQEFAKKHFPNENPIGRIARFGITHDTAETGKGSAQVMGEIVGIVGDVKQQDLATPAYPAVHEPFHTCLRPPPPPSSCVRTRTRARSSRA